MQMYIDQWTDTFQHLKESGAKKYPHSGQAHLSMSETLKMILFLHYLLATWDNFIKIHHSKEQLEFEPIISAAIQRDYKEREIINDSGSKSWKDKAYVTGSDTQECTYCKKRGKP